MLVSAGFDGHWRDPLAHMGLTLHWYAHTGAKLVALAEELCESRIVVFLEGGYDLEIVSCGVANLVRALRRRDDWEDPVGPARGRGPVPEELLAQAEKLVDSVPD
jgi:acetoin utilization deacetylase AcuC-like enzyme